MKVYGLLGLSLGHSFSQKYFTEKFQKENIKDCLYSNFEIASLIDGIPLLKQMRELSGLNVTIPYKAGIIPFLDELSAECTEMNACNCIKITRGKWIGHNTDVTGFETSFRPLLQAHHTKALILGTGGAASAVAFVLKKAGISFLYVSRTPNALLPSIGYEKIDSQILKEYKIVINTTPSGMYPNVDDYPKIPYEYIGPQHYFFDLIYNPGKTLFLKKAAMQGAMIMNGSMMLEIQAEESWKIWNGDD